MLESTISYILHQGLVVPNIKSAIKRVKVSERNRVRNKSWRSAVRTVRSQVIDLVKIADQEKAAEALKNAYQVIDKAVSKGILHRNSAARKKSRLAEQVLRLGSQPKNAKSAKAPKASKTTKATKTARSTKAKAK